MKTVYVGIIIAIVVLGVFTIPYKRNLRRTLKRKEYPLKFIFGQAMFLTDKFIKKQENKNGFLNKAIRELKAKEDVKKDKYLYTVNKMAFSLLGIIVTLVIGVGIEISSDVNDNQIKSLKRDSYSSTTYNIYSHNEKGEEKPLAIDVGQKELKEEEIVEEIKKQQSKLVKKF